MGFESTIDYLVHAARRVHEETGLLPHVNPGVMRREELVRLREVSVSAGIMLESTARRLCEKGGPHYGSPDKDPEVRLATLERAGELAVPFTTGILIGIGETRRERVEALLAIRDLDDRHGHVQEVIVQNFRAKAGTPMAAAPEPSLEDHLWTIAVARLVLGPGTSVQAPPNLRPGVLGRLIEAGLDDWGGVSPVTPDHVNPEAALAASDRARARHRGGGQIARAAAPDPSALRGRPRTVGRSGAPKRGTRGKRRPGAWARVGLVCGRRGAGTGEPRHRRVFRGAGASRAHKWEARIGYR